MNLDSTLAVTKTCPKDGVHLSPGPNIGRVQTAVQWAGNSRETGSLGPAPSAIPSSWSSKLLDVNNF